MRHAKQVGLVMVAVLMVLALVLSCAPTAPEELGPVKIGALGDFTGEAAGTGDLFKMGIEVRLDQAGWEVAGRKIEFIMEDSGSSGDISLANARKMVEMDGVHVILGPMMPNAGAAVVDYLEPSGIPMLGYYQNPDEWMEKYDHFFSPGGGMRWYYYPLGEYVAKELGYKTAVAMCPDVDFGYLMVAGFESGFEDNGGTVVDEVGVPFGTMDYGPYLPAMKGVDAVATFFVEPMGALRFFKQYIEFGVEAKILLIGTDTVEPILPELGDWPRGMIGQNPWPRDEIDTEVSNRFVEDFVNKYGFKPISYSLMSYNSTGIFLEAVKATGGDTTPEKLIQALQKVKLECPNGPISFLPAGEAILTEYIVEMVKKDGEYGEHILKVVTECGGPPRR